LWFVFPTVGVDMRFDLDIDLDNTIDLRVQATFNYFANEVKQQVNG